MISSKTLFEKEATVCVVGLGYVGLPLAVLLTKHFDVIGVDVNTKKIDSLKQGIDTMGEVSAEALAASTLRYTDDPAAIADASFIIVAVPTPVDEHNIPNLDIVRAAAKTVGAHMQEGSIVVFESTVYPGVTMDICVPILEQASGFTCNTEFGVGYSPERVNPGDTEHTIDTIVKVVSGSNDAVSQTVSEVYSAITNTYQASSIPVAEAAKVIENVQRDINIGLMNELLMLFHAMGISTTDVLAAAKTKWNFLPFTPGLVGGHCIGVDPYYLTYKAQELGITTNMILAGRGVNDGMASFFVQEVIKKAIQQHIDLSEAVVVIYGVTFKENVKDVRNSKVVDIYRELVSYGLTVHITDPIADPTEVAHEYDITLTPSDALPQANIAIYAVTHTTYKERTATDILTAIDTDSPYVIADLKHMYPTLSEHVSDASLLTF
jgi:UDP-N-acetyl-D-galactosamine dehydrogenase